MPETTRRRKAVSVSPAVRPRENGTAGVVVNRSGRIGRRGGGRLSRRRATWGSTVGWRFPVRGRPRTVAGRFGVQKGERGGSRLPARTAETAERRMGTDALAVATRQIDAAIHSLIFPGRGRSDTGRSAVPLQLPVLGRISARQSILIQARAVRRERANRKLRSDARPARQRRFARPAQGTRRGSSARARTARGSTSIRTARAGGRARSCAPCSARRSASRSASLSRCR